MNLYRQWRYRHPYRMFKMESVSFGENRINAINDARVSAIGALFGAWYCPPINVNPQELERIKQYHLMKIQSAGGFRNQYADDIGAHGIYAVYQRQKYTTENPTINKAIRYIQTNITEKVECRTNC